MTRSPERFRRSVWSIVSLMALSALIVALMSNGAVPTSARLLFQSPGQSPLETPTLPPPTPLPVEPTPEPPTPELPTPEPPTPELPTPEPPTPTLEPATATPLPPEPLPPEPATAEPASVEPTPTPPLLPEPVVPSEPTPEPSPTPETVHLPAVEVGSEPEEPASAAVGDTGAVQAVPPESSDQTDTAQVIDGLVVILSYVWLACGALLLVFVPVGLVLMNRWGKRRRG